MNRWGLRLQGGQVYEVVVVLPAEATTEVLVSLETGGGERILAEQAIVVPGDGSWHTSNLNLTPSATEVSGRFALRLHRPGAIWVDY